jgi:hypothetical protein
MLAHSIQTWNICFVNNISFIIRLVSQWW